MGACGSLSSTSTSAATGSPRRANDQRADCTPGEAPRHPRKVHPQADPAGGSGGGGAAGAPLAGAAPVLLGQPPPARKAAPGGDDGELLVVVRVVKAELNHSCLKVGRMDPHALVVWQNAEGCRWDGSRTRTDQNGHLSPQWEHTCSGQPYAGRGGGDTVEFRVKDRDTSLGVACVGVDDLLGRAASSATEPGGAPAVGSVRQLDLRLDGESAGTITVQGLLYKHDRKLSCSGSGVLAESLTRIDPALFHHPVKRVGVAGGTAPFFNLVLNTDALATSNLPLLGNITRDYYIGKDLSHAADEVTFYEEALALSEKAGKGGMGALMSFLVDYLGVLTAEEDVPPEKKQKPRDLLVMKNLKCGFRKLRMLDIKIGQKTAQAGWQGKSRMAALRGSVVDGVTNSSCEGYRLEGFDGRPPSLESMDPMLDLGVTGDRKVVKKALRVMLQRMSGAEMLMHFMDIHQDGAEGTAQLDEDVDEHLARVEVAELSHHEIVRRLAGLALACRQCPVPQKWIGSSVALGYDCGEPPRRDAPEEEVRSATIVQLFDWGRSELNTLEKHMAMSDEDQHDRAQFWSYYVGGVDRLLWEAARAYRHRFGNAEGWSAVTLTLYDFDSMSDNDRMGAVTVPLEPTPETTVNLLRDNGSNVTGTFRGTSTLTYSVVKRPLPAGSRLAYTWQVRVIRAENLPRMDMMQGRGTSDPFCTVTAVSELGDTRFRQQTSVKARNLNPEWNEVFDLPVAAGPGGLEAALEEVSPALVRESLDWVLPPEAHSSYRDSGAEAVRPTGSLASFNPLSAPRRTNAELEELKAREFADRLDSAAADHSRDAEWQMPAATSGWRSRYWRSFEQTSCTSIGALSVEVEEEPQRARGLLSCGLFACAS